MSKISMATAESISKREAAKKYDSKINDSEQAFKKFLTEKVKEKYPAHSLVGELIKAESGWIRHETSVGIYKLDEDRYSKQFELSESLPVQIHSQVKLDATKEIKNRYEKMEELKTEKKKFRSELERIILGLGTPKRVVEQIPELKEYFENQLVKSTALIPIEQIKEIRKKLKQ